jgi:hypothetical protein
LLAAVLLAAAGISGCATWDPATWDPLRLRGDGFPEEDQQLMQGYRPREPGAKPFSFSTKGQQIERDFGFGS